jgi:hypothetical protein
MATAIELCAPCQEAFRSARIYTICGPSPQPLYWQRRDRRTSQHWECALCVTIGAIKRLSERPSRRHKLSALWTSIRPSGRAVYQFTIHGLQSPNVVGNLADILLVSSKMQRSQFRGSDAAVLLDAGQLASYLRVVPEKMIDMTLVQHWMSRCEATHESCRASPLPCDLRLVLVDVRRKCLVLTSSAPRYFALSYVWGSTVQFQLHQANLQELLNTGALQDVWCDIPTVIKSAMKFVQDLGETYLWVDTLCIIQDSPGRLSYITRMNEVYSGAVCTLIAMEGSSASTPLHGVEPNSRDLDYLYQTDDFSIVRRRADIASACAASKYETRAWTFQERILSRKCLYFTREQLYFQCWQTIWSEDRYEVHRQNFGDSRVFPSLHEVDRHSNLSWQAKYRTSVNLVEQYTRRDMTVSEDRLNAFAGVVSNLLEQWDWQFVAGLPVPVLDLALLWTHSAPGYHRIWSFDSNRHLPSWSWAGWTQGVQYYMFPSVTSSGQLPTSLSRLNDVVPYIDHFSITANGAVNSLHVSAERAPKFPLITEALTKTPTPHDDDITIGDAHPVSSALYKTSNLLIFEADTLKGPSLVTFEAFQSVAQPPHMRHLREFRDVPHRRLRRIQGQKGTAGILLDAGMYLAPRLSNEYLFLLISKAPGLPCVRAFENLHDDWDDETERDNIYRSYVTSVTITCNLLLVKINKQGFYERVAVGQMLEKAWLEAEPVRREIVLG